MTKIIQFSAKTYSDAVYVEGMANHDRNMEFELERHCRRYFNENYKRFFFCGEDERMEIYQNSFIKLWENIEKGKLYVKEGVLYGADKKPFTGRLTTYFMSIAKFKYLEYARSNKYESDVDIDDKKGNLHNCSICSDDTDFLYDKSSLTMEDIIADCIAVMSDRCNQLLKKFYYEEKSLDVILTEIPTITNKNALKTMKFKCMSTLRSNAKSMYNRYCNC